MSSLSPSIARMIAGIRKREEKTLTLLEDVGSFVRSINIIYYPKFCDVTYHGPRMRQQVQRRGRSIDVEQATELGELREQRKGVMRGASLRTKPAHR